MFKMNITSVIQSSINIKNIMMPKNTITLLMCLSVFNLAAQDTLKTVKVEANSRSIKKSFTVTSNTTVMTGRELLKAACCNLAESFETNPSIDVNFADALTGTKQIKML